MNKNLSLFDYNDLYFNEMQIDDYNEIYNLWKNTPGMGLDNADSFENISKFLIKNGKLCFVCKHEGRIVGTILCGNDGRRGYIYHVAVDVNYRGKGIGKSLVDKSLQRLKDEGVAKCHLFVFADNEIGNSFWNSTGWQKRDDVYVYSKFI